MKKNNLLIILLVIVIALVAVWALFFRSPSVTEPTEPIVEAPVLNNTLETTVTVIDPNAAVQ